MSELPPGYLEVLKNQPVSPKSSSRSSGEVPVVSEPIAEREKSPKRKPVGNNPKTWKLDPKQTNWAIHCLRLDGYITGLVHSEKEKVDEDSDDGGKKHSKKHKKKSSKKHKKKKTHAKKQKKPILVFTVTPFYPRISGFMKIKDCDVLNLINVDTGETVAGIDLGEYNTRLAEWVMKETTKTNDDDDPSGSEEEEPTLKEFRKQLQKPKGVIVSEDRRWRLTLCIVKHPSKEGEFVIRLDKIKVNLNAKADVGVKNQAKLDREVKDLLEFNEKNNIATVVEGKRVRRSRFSALDMKLLLFNCSDEEEDDENNSLKDESVEIPVEEDE
jgi:hypothetical protein